MISIRCGAFHSPVMRCDDGLGLTMQCFAMPPIAKTAPEMGQDFLSAHCHSVRGQALICAAGQCLAYLCVATSLRLIAEKISTAAAMCRDAMHGFLWRCAAIQYSPAFIGWKISIRCSAVLSTAMRCPATLSKITRLLTGSFHFHSTAMLSPVVLGCALHAVAMPYNIHRAETHDSFLCFARQFSAPLCGALHYSSRHYKTTPSFGGAAL